MPIEDFPWRSGKKIRNSQCKYCRNEMHSRLSRTPHYRWRNAKKLAERTNIEWKIEENSFIALIQLPCHYCEGLLHTTGSGLDRMKPKEGYYSENVVTCCKRCNALKSDYFSYDEMMLMKPILSQIRKSRDSMEGNDGK